MSESESTFSLPYFLLYGIQCKHQFVLWCLSIHSAYPFILPILPFCLSIHSAYSSILPIHPLCLSTHSAYPSTLPIHSFFPLLVSSLYMHKSFIASSYDNIRNFNTFYTVCMKSLCLEQKQNWRSCHLTTVERVKRYLYLGTFEIISHRSWAVLWNKHYFICKSHFTQELCLLLD